MCHWTKELRNVEPLLIPDDSRGQSSGAGSRYFVWERNMRWRGLFYSALLALSLALGLRVPDTGKKPYGVRPSGFLFMPSVGPFSMHIGTRALISRDEKIGVIVYRIVANHNESLAVFSQQGQKGIDTPLQRLGNAEVSYRCVQS